MEWQVNPVVKYRAEIIDSNGRMLMQSGEKEITAEFTCRWVYECLVPDGGADLVKKKKAADDAVQKVAVVLADTLRRSRTEKRQSRIYGEIATLPSVARNDSVALVNSFAI